MIYIWQNATAIGLAALASLALAIPWYRKPIKPPAVLTLFLANVWLGAILAGALILAPPKSGVWTMTIGSAVVIWAGFIAPALAASYRIRSLPWRTALTDGGYWLVGMLIQAILMRLIGLVPPSA
jgi:hypothetical protein